MNQNIKRIAKKVLNILDYLFLLIIFPCIFYGFIWRLIILAGIQNGYDVKSPQGIFTSILIFSMVSIMPLSIGGLFMLGIHNLAKQLHAWRIERRYD